MDKLIQRTLLITLSLLPAVAASAQFSVVAVSPGDGAVNVPTLATFQLTFSAPLDTTARFDPEDNFYLAIESNPNIAEPLFVGVSPDRTVFTAQLLLDADTQYLFLLTGAKSESGELLDHPYVWTISTGPTLPSGSMTGVVTDAGGGKAIDGATVALFPDTPDGGLLADNTEAPFAAAVVNAAGQYTVPYLPAGSYQVVAVRDSNGDGQLDPDLGDSFGLYDGNADGLLDPVDVADGQSVAGINFSIKLPTPVTAQTYEGTATAIATSMWPDAQLVSVDGFLQPGGLATMWFYVFYSASNTDALALAAIGDQFIIGPFQDFGGQVDQTVPLPSGWMDSDQIAGIADANGGSDFVATWDDVEVWGFAGNITEIFGKSSGKSVHASGAWGLSRPAATDARASGKTGAAAVTPTPLWWVTYWGASADGLSFGFMNIFIHAVTGEVDPALAYYTAAAEHLDVANAAAQNWSPVAELVTVKSGIVGVHRTGLSSEWIYTYRSPASNTAYRYEVQEGVIVSEGPENIAFLRSTQELPASWVDSPPANATAETESGGFRTQYPSNYVEATLARDIDFNNPTRPVWEFNFFDNMSGTTLTVLIDASTGLVVGTEDENEVPSSLTLDQNYPNPFNPSTSITYEVPSAGPVRLSVFDVLGREVRVLVDAEQTAARYTISWDGRDENGHEVSSGIYVYRVEAGGSTQTRSMTLLR